ncbi:MAG TPA: DNA-binding response regulator [Proteiniclasticum sp.]|jgi:DNA-binding response OmpR family regulator|nr:response regulator transcription factor [Proteiniclasticum sp.]HBW12953.1 DNA-binding response regulator [Proteiniclasticum sp.]
MNLLIADDHKQITSILSDYAKKEGYTVMIANDGKEALSLFSRNTFDLVLLDVMMPEMDGFQVCREIRKTSSVPIIMVTARGEDFERIMGLDMGADDYIVKPFSPGEVMARIRAILRRISPDPKESQDKNILIYDNLTINIEEFTVLIEAESVSLTKKEIEILYTMAKNPNKLFTRDNLLNSLWGYDYFGDARTVDSHIKRLRAKLDSYHHPNWEIKTVWGMGYKFEVEHEL